MSSTPICLVSIEVGRVPNIDIFYAYTRIHASFLLKLKVDIMNVYCFFTT